MINCGKKKLGNVEKVDTFPEKYNLPDWIPKKNKTLKNQ
jgi:hypothetical protein